jgi:hypothetical protein
LKHGRERPGKVRHLPHPAVAAIDIPFGDLVRNYLAFPDSASLLCHDLNGLEMHHRLLETDDKLHQKHATGN